MRASQVTVEFAPLTLPIPTSTNSSIASYTTLGYQNQSGTTSSGLSSAITPDSTLPVGALSIDRRTLLYGWDNNGPPVLVANLTIQAPGQHATGLRIKSATLNGNISLQHTYPYYGDSWHVVTLAPNPEYGWVAVSLWQPTTIVLDVHMICGADDAVKVHITVPAPGFPQSFAAEVKAAASSAQFIALAAGGGSSGAALGRLMATRSMVMCDADGAVGGGVLDLGFVPCSMEDNSNNVARSAVISNIVLVCIVALVLFLVGFVLALADPTHSVVSAFRDASSIILLPSSLLTVFVSVLPSTAASATVLAARIGSSRCTGADAVLVILSIILLATPISAVLLLYSHIGRHRWECRNDFPTHALKLEASGLLRKAQTMFHQATRRRWKWQKALEAPDQSLAIFQNMWVVLLEYRTVWYAAVDGCGLVAVGAFSVVGGLSSSSCHPFTGLVIALLCLQLLILNVSRPYTTLFEHVCSAATLGLTLLSVVGQLVFTLETPGPEWVLTMSAVCNLAIVGVSLVKSVLDASSLLMGLRRRILNARDARSPEANRSPKLKSLEGSVSFSEHGHDDEEGPLRLNYEADSHRDLVDGGSFDMHMMQPPLAEDVQVVAEIEDRFWDVTGAAKVHGSSSSSSIIGEDTSTVVVQVGKEKDHTDRSRRSDAIVKYSLDGDILMTYREKMIRERSSI